MLESAIRQIVPHYAKLGQIREAHASS